MTRAAPRYDLRIVEAIRELDEDGVSLAETCRRVGTRADALDLPRPSIVHLRTLVAAERAFRREHRRARDQLIRLLDGHHGWDVHTPLDAAGDAIEARDRAHGVHWRSRGP